MAGVHADGVSGSGVSQPDRGQLTEDDLFELLANPRRRHVLHALMGEDDTLEIGPLATEIAAWEDGIEPEAVSSSDRKRVYTALQQSHLPKMDETGVVDFDASRGTVEPTSTLADVEIYIDVVRGGERPWSDYYLGLTALSGVLFVVATVEVVPFSGLPSQAWGVFVVVAFGISALAHRYLSRRNRLGIDGDPPAITPEHHP